MHAMRTSILAPTLNRLYDPGCGAIMPDRLAASLKAQLSDVARIAGVHRNSLASAPTSPKVQARLGEVARILAEAAELLDGDENKAAVWFRHQPLAGFDGETAEDLVAAGHAAAVRAHLRMLRDGAYA
jgi:uncharacterized protein (DUF2384 family)